MKIDRGLALAVAVALAASAVAGDAQAQRGRDRRGGAASLPQVSCPNATASRAAGDAQASLNRTLIPNLSAADREAAFNAAATAAEAAMAAEPNNPYLPHIAAQAHLGLGHVDQAVAQYRKVAELCPELNANTTTELFNTGIERYQGGDTTAALALWQGVTQLDSAHTNALFNLGVVYTQRGDQARAAEVFRRVASMPPAEGDTTAAERRASALSAVLSAGNALFGQDKFREAGELFTFVHTVDPNFRDAWYNHALALYKLESWQELIPVATRLVQMDPLNYNAQIVLFNAYKGISEAAKAQNNTALETQNRNMAVRVLEQADALPVQLDQVRFAADTPGSVTVTGVVTGAAAAAGTPVQLEFTLTNLSGELGKGTVTVTAPAKDATTNFSFAIPTSGAPTGYTYRLVR